MFRYWSLGKCVIFTFGCRSVNNHPSGYLGMVSDVERITSLRINLLMVIAITVMVDFPTKTDLTNVGVGWYLSGSVRYWVLPRW